MEKLNHQAGAPLLFDEAEILDRMDNDRDFLKMILEESLVELPKLLQELRELCQSEEAAAIRRQAHTIKGVAANIGTPALHAICLGIEAAAKDGDIKAAQQLLPELEETALMTMEAVRAFG